MKTYKILEAVTINAEKIKLDDDQAARREHVLQKTRTKGVYIPLAPLTFKAGEEIGVDGKIAKANLSKMVCEEDLKAEEEAKAKAEAEEKKKAEAEAKKKAEEEAKAKNSK